VGWRLGEVVVRRSGGEEEWRRSGGEEEEWR
jgi:hypothetical protein